MFREIRRVLRPHGVLLVVTLSRTRALPRNRRGRQAFLASLRRRFTGVAARSMVRTYSTDEIVRLAAGFHVVEQREAGGPLVELLFRRDP